MHTFLLFLLLLQESICLDYSLEYEAPEPYEILHNFCSDCNPKVEVSPDPLVSMTWSPNVNESKLQIYRVFDPIEYKVSPSSAIKETDLFKMMTPITIVNDFHDTGTGTGVQL